MYAIDAVPHTRINEDDIDESSRNPMCAVRTEGHQLGTVMAQKGWLKITSFIFPTGSCVTRSDFQKYIIARSPR